MAEDDRNSRGTVAYRYQKKIWCPTIEAYRRQDRSVSVVELCGIFGYSKQAYYKQLRCSEEEAFDEYLIVGLIRSKREIWKKGSGRNLLKALRKDFSEHDIKIGRDKFFDILRRNGLLMRCKKRRAKTTDSYHRYHKYPNIIRGKIPLKANEIWVSDITYIWLSEEDCFCYLFLITDLYSRKIIGYCVQATLEATGALKSLQMALRCTSTQRTSGCIHHSDRGIQYCCDAYVQKLQQEGFQISMTEQSDPLENAVAERINKTIKEEFTNEKEISFPTLAKAQQSIARFIDFYNHQRPHRSIDWLTPAEAYYAEGELKRHWKMYKK
jgi:transposase InsO family protein